MTGRRGGVTFLIDPASSPGALRAAWDAYSAYLATVQDRMPPGAWAFAVAPWHYDAQDPRCPHDGWVESLTIREAARGERSEQRRVEIALDLLGAYHDGHLRLRYQGVHSYALRWPGRSRNHTELGHEDWRVDEVRLSDHGRALHEVHFETAVWLVECADIEVAWHPVAATQA